MRARYAGEIRRGILQARNVVARRRVAPALTPLILAQRGARLPLWERAYRHEMDRLVRVGVIRPPRGPSGVGRR